MTTATTFSRIDQVFATLREEQRMAFIPFIAAGDPDLAGTQTLIQTLAAGGADLIEVGFPYSDPIADGPVIQESYTRALQQKVTVPQIFAAVAALPTAKLPPLVAMVSYAIIFRYGTQRFIAEAKQAGFCGFIVPDLPDDEASELAPLMQAAGVNLIQLLAPTTTRERATRIVAHSSGFIYCIAVAGITGEREKIADELLEQLRWLKTQTDTPLAVGFGIGKPEHLAPLRNLADGAIVGSAIVKLLHPLTTGEKTFDEVVANIRQFVESMATAAHTSN